MRVRIKFVTEDFRKIFSIYSKTIFHFFEYKYYIKMKKKTRKTRRIQLCHNNLRIQIKSYFS